MLSTGTELRVPASTFPGHAEHMTHPDTTAHPWTAPSGTPPIPRSRLGIAPTEWRGSPRAISSSEPSPWPRRSPDYPDHRRVCARPHRTLGRRVDTYTHIGRGPVATRYPRHTNRCRDSGAVRAVAATTSSAPDISGFESARHSSDTGSRATGRSTIRRLHPFVAGGHHRRRPAPESLGLRSEAPGFRRKHPDANAVRAAAVTDRGATVSAPAIPAVPAVRPGGVDRCARRGRDLTDDPSPDMRPHHNCRHSRAQMTIVSGDPRSIGRSSTRARHRRFTVGRRRWRVLLGAAFATILIAFPLGPGATAAAWSGGAEVSAQPTAGDTAGGRGSTGVPLVTSAVAPPVSDAAQQEPYPAAAGSEAVGSTAVAACAGSGSAPGSGARPRSSPGSGSADGAGSSAGSACTVVSAFGALLRTLIRLAPKIAPPACPCPDGRR